MDRQKDRWMDVGQKNPIEINTKQSVVISLALERQVGP